MCDLMGTRHRQSLAIAWHLSDYAIAQLIATTEPHYASHRESWMANVSVVLQSSSVFSMVMTSLTPITHENKDGFDLI